MASVESLQCPNCGNRITNVTAGETVYCEYCGSTLHVKGDPAAVATAEATRLGNSTELIALEKARDRIVENIAKARRAIYSLDEERQELANREPSHGVLRQGVHYIMASFGTLIFLGGICVCFQSSSFGEAIGKFAFYTVFSFLLMLPLIRYNVRRAKWRRDVLPQEKPLKAEIAEKNIEIHRMADRIEEIEGRMDKLARQI